MQQNNFVMLVLLALDVIFSNIAYHHQRRGLPASIALLLNAGSSATVAAMAASVLRLHLSSEQAWDPLRLINHFFLLCAHQLPTL